MSPSTVDNNFPRVPLMVHGNSKSESPITVEGNRREVTKKDTLLRENSPSVRREELNLKEFRLHQS